MGRVLLLTYPSTDGWDRDIYPFLVEGFRRHGFDPVECPIDSGLPADPAEAVARLRARLEAEKSVSGGESLALHPGFSFWSERPELGTLCQELGLNVFAPSPRVLTLFGNRLSLLLESERLGIPNLLSHPDPIYSLREVEALVHSGGQRMPFVLKSSRNVSGSDHFVAYDPEQIQARLPLWLEQLRRNTGEVIIFAERYIEGGRKLEVPFVRLHDGRTVVFPRVDTSLQSRNRRLVEFCPPQNVDPVAEIKLVEWVRHFAENMGYVGVGSLEFLVDGTHVWLVGGSARLTSSFHLWERVAGTEALAWQIAAYAGGHVPPRELPRVQPRKQWSHGIALRIYAEDPVLQLPRPGRIVEVSDRRHWGLPNAEAELQLSVKPGDDVPAVGRGRLGVLWAGAQDRAQAMRVARGVLEETWVAGSLETNQRFLGEVLTHPWVSEGIFHAGFIDEEFLPQLRPSADWLPFFASVCESISDSGELQDIIRGGGVPSFRWAVGDQWCKPLPAGMLHWTDGPVQRDYGGLPGISGSIELKSGRTARVCAYPLRPSAWLVRLGEWTLQVRRVDASKRAAAPKAPPRLHALVSGRVHSLLFREGTLVPAHEPLAIVESLGTLVPHAIPVDARVVRWVSAAEDRVTSGEAMAELEIVHDAPGSRHV